mgnify:CR=1 FL=1
MKSPLDALRADPPPPKGDVLPAIKAHLKEARERIFASAVPADAPRKMAEAMDEIVRAAAAWAARTTKDGSEPWALFALGGYGRLEFCPYSDVDLMVFAPDAVGDRAAGIATALFQLLWDLGLQVGHAVRTWEECAAFLGDDVESSTALLEARFLEGSESARERFETSFEHILRIRARPFLEHSIRRMRERHAQFGGSIYRMEPNLKENPGMLRDLQAVRAFDRIAAASPELSPFRPSAVVPAAALAGAEEAYAFLLRIRSWLHLEAGRRMDVLESRLQPLAASALGIRGDDSNRPEENLMREVFRGAGAIHGVLRRSLQDLLSPLASPGRGLPVRRLPHDWVEIGGTLHLGPRKFEDVAREPWRLVEIFRIAQRHRLEVSEEILLAVRERMSVSPTEALRTDPRAAGEFRDVLRGVGNAASALRQMHDARLLGEMIPEFGALTGLVRFTMVHDYTVDEHSLLAVEEIDRLETSTEAADGRLRAVLERIPRPDLLKLALLVHDVGKCREAGHHEVGADLASGIAVRLGLSEADARRLRFLVKNHLLMAEISEQRNVHGHDAARALAAEAVDLEGLDMLYLMAHADIRATGAGALPGWKAAILADLHAAAEARLAGSAGAAPPGRVCDALAEAAGPKEAAAAIAHADGMPAAYALEVPCADALAHLRLIRRAESEGLASEVRWRESHAELWISTRDQPALFARISGVLSALGANVWAATAYTRRDGWVLDVFRIARPDGRLPSDVGLAGRIDAALKKVLIAGEPLEPMLERRRRRIVVRARTYAPVAPTVRFHNKTAPDATILDVTAADRPGLLYDMAKALAEEGLDLRLARISTRGNLAINSFYATLKPTGEKILDEGVQRRIRDRLIAACGGVG